MIMGNTFARDAWNHRITELCGSKTLSINHLELLAVAIAVEVFNREGLLPTDNRRIDVRGDNIGASDIANKWTAEGPIMDCILRILHNTCIKHQVRIWLIHISTTDNFWVDGLSRSPDFQASSPKLRNGNEVSPTKELDNWLTKIIKTAQSEANRARNKPTNQRHYEPVNNENANTINDHDRVAIQ